MNSPKTVHRSEIRGTKREKLIIYATSLCENLIRLYTIEEFVKEGLKS